MLRTILVPTAGTVLATLTMLVGQSQKKLHSHAFIPTKPLGYVLQAGTLVPVHWPLPASG